MKRIALIFLMVLSFLFVACAPIDGSFNPFEYNTFSELEETPGDALNEQLDSYDPVTATPEQKKEIVSAFVAAAEDEGFITDLEGDEARKTLVVETLESSIGVATDDTTGQQVVTVPVFTTPEERADYQDAALTLAVVETATTGGDEFVTNLGGLLETMMSPPADDPDNPDGGEEEELKPETIIASLVPESMLVSEPVFNPETGLTEEKISIPTDDPVVKDAFVGMIEGLVAADLALDALGQSLETETVFDEETGTTKEVPVFEDEEIVAADITQTAVVASLVGSLSETISTTIPDDENGDPALSSAEVIFALAADDPDDPNDGIVVEEGTITLNDSFGDPITVPLDLTEFDPFADLDPESDSGTATLVSASGLDTLLSGFFGGDDDAATVQ